MSWQNTSAFSGVLPSGGADNPIISAADLAEWIGLASPSDAEAARLQTATEIATGYVTAEVGSPVWLVTADSVTLDGTGEEWFTLPDTPVVGVTSVTVDGVLLDAATYSWSRSGRVYRGTYPSRLCWTRKRRSIVVVYDHGYATVPREAAGAALTSAARVYANMDGRVVQREARGTYLVHYYDTDAEGALTPSECALLAPLKTSLVQ